MSDFEILYIIGYIILFIVSIIMTRLYFIELDKRMKFEFKLKELEYLWYLYKIEIGKEKE